MEKECKIDCLLLSILILQLFRISSQVFFLISIGYFVILLVQSKFVLKIPKIAGIKMYLIFIVYAALVGIFVSNPFRMIVRDLFYVLPTILWIMCGTQLLYNKKKKAFSILKTLYLYIAMLSLYSWASFILSGTMDFMNLRFTFGFNIYDIGLIAPIFWIDVFSRKKVFFSYVLDRFIAFLTIGQILLSFGRIAILAPIVGCFVILFVLMFHRKVQVRKFSFIKFIFLIVAVIIVFKIIPKDITSIFMDKVQSSLSEIDSSQTINSVGEATNKWRAYENITILEEWKKSDIVTQVFGNGFGSGTKLEYVPSSWHGALDEDKLPLAHNGFMTLLQKGGVFSVISLIVIYLSLIIKGIKNVKYRVGNVEYYAALTGVNIAAIALTYVVRGPIQQGAFLSWALLITVLSSERLYEECN